MVSRAPSSLSLSLSLLAAGCAWDLPVPRVRDAGPTLDVHDAATDARPSDARDAHDDARVSDVPAMDAGTDTGVTDVGVVDAGTDTGPVDLGVMDVGVVDTGTDLGRVDVGVVVDVGVDVGWPECVPGTRRSCYTGPESSRGRGICRDGVQTCATDGTWPTTEASCVGQVVPDCAGRACGSDGCGDSCGGCASPEVCDETGQCAAVTCGMANFVLNCPGVGLCPLNGACGMTGCACAAGFAARTCDGDPCPASGCSYPDWFCQRALFCAAGAVACTGGYRCPRYSRCVTDTRSCECLPGFVAVTCAGDRCTSCPGTDYRCVPSG